MIRICSSSLSAAASLSYGSGSSTLYVFFANAA